MSSMGMRLAFLTLLVFAATAQAKEYPAVRAELEAKRLAQATQQFSATAKRVPTGDEWPEVLTQPPEGVSPSSIRYMLLISADPWGNPYRYVSCAAPGAECQIYSYGANGKDDGGLGDDVTSWSGYSSGIYFPNAARDWILIILGVFLGLAGLSYLHMRVDRYLWTKRRERLTSGAHQ